MSAQHFRCDPALPIGNGLNLTWRSQGHRTLDAAEPTADTERQVNTYGLATTKKREEGGARDRTR
jgi:hypothetical protein